MSLSSRLAGLKPFSRKRRDEEGDDDGDYIDAATHAGGDVTVLSAQDEAKATLPVSPALQAFLVHEGVLSEGEIASSLADDQENTTATEASGPMTMTHSPALTRLLQQPHVLVPPEAKDLTHPLPEYFISSSHNTYLLAHQLYGGSSAEAYVTALRTGSRCVEIDAWDNDADPNEPKVTHGFTFVSSIPFRDVCLAIRRVIDEDVAAGLSFSPILISLENHCGPRGQLRLAQITAEVFGPYLLQAPIGLSDEEALLPQAPHARLRDLYNKVVLIVEHHIEHIVHADGTVSDSDSCDDDSDSDSDREDEARNGRRNKTKDDQKVDQKTVDAKIIPELARLGVYAQSVKPSNHSWFEDGVLRNGPHHHLINVSESGLRKHLAQFAQKIARHNGQHLMRVYPRGTRISSANLNPVPFWAIGAQICALNWQTFNGSMQLNGALFHGTDGFLLKPEALRTNGSGSLQTGIAKKLTLHVAGASNVPLFPGKTPKDIKPYLTCQLIHPETPDAKAIKRKTFAYKESKLPAFLSKHDRSSPTTDPVWNETLTWEYHESELVFLRMILKSDDSFAANPNLVVGTVLLRFLVTGEWRFVRMMDMHGRDSNCSILIRAEVTDA